MTSARPADIRPTRTLAVLALAGIGGAAVLAGAALALPAASRVGYAELYATDLAIGAGFTTIGALAVLRRPANRTGWLFLAIGVIEALTGALNHYAIVGLSDGAALPAARWAGWLAYWSVSLVVPSGLFLALLLVFPDGRPVSRIWGGVAVTGIMFGAAFALSEILLLPRMEITPEIEIDNPTNVLSTRLFEGIWIFGLALLLVGVTGAVVRYRRSRGDERQQLRWFVFVAGSAIGSLALIVLVYFAIGAPTPEPTWFLVSAAIVPLLGIGVGVPVACGIAIFKYRLWDLDVVIRKAVVAAVVAGVISLVYVGIVGGVGALVGSRLDTALGFVAAAVLALAFQPIRTRAGHLADRLVYGRRATPYEVLADFSERMAEAYATDDVLPRMVRVLAEGTGAEAATVWVLVAGELRPTASWPEERHRRPVRTDQGVLPTMPEPAFEVRHRGELLGALSVAMPANDPMDPTKERLARDLAAQAGLVLRNVALIEELRASRTRLVAAQDDERRKLERNLHDGAQQQLVALQVQLRLVEQQVGKDAERELAMLRGVQDAARAALEDLRDLARGIYPPLLADQGLVAALAAQASRSPVAVAVDGDGIGRYPREIESAVYFCTLEALNNVAKYAEASSVRVELVEEDGELRFRVVDDGRGFDVRAARHGTGVQGMADRLEAIGGSLEIRSAPGAGTTITGTAPIGHPA